MGSGVHDLYGGTSNPSAQWSENKNRTSISGGPPGLRTNNISKKERAWEILSAHDGGSLSNCGKWEKCPKNQNREIYYQFLKWKIDENIEA